MNTLQLQLITREIREEVYLQRKFASYLEREIFNDVIDYLQSLYAVEKLNNV